jgi:hypothetical protein
MPSPFSGMDPYVEPRWSNVHVLMMGALAAGLKRVLPPGLQARPEESVRIQSLAGDRLRDYRPDVALVDVAVITTPPARPAAVAGVTARPIELAVHREPIVTRNIEIVDLQAADRVVTVIEVLSPRNTRSGPLNDDYRDKLGDYEAAGANWVELDLLRSSRRHLAVTWDDLPPGERRDYLAVVFRAATARLSAYPFGVRDLLPTIAIPLRRGDADVPLDLQAAFDRVYDEGPFDDIDYHRPPVPPLSDADAAWAAERLAARGQGRT